MEMNIFVVVRMQRSVASPEHLADYAGHMGSLCQSAFVSVVSRLVV